MFDASPLRAHLVAALGASALVGRSTRPLRRNIAAKTLVHAPPSRLPAFARALVCGIVFSLLVGACTKCGNEMSVPSVVSPISIPGIPSAVADSNRLLVVEPTGHRHSRLVIVDISTGRVLYRSEEADAVVLPSTPSDDVYVIHYDQRDVVFAAIHADGRRLAKKRVTVPSPTAEIEWLAHGRALLGINGRTLLRIDPQAGRLVYLRQDLSISARPGSRTPIANILLAECVPDVCVFNLDDGKQIATLRGVLSGNPRRGFNALPSEDSYFTVLEGDLRRHSIDGTVEWTRPLAPRSEAPEILVSKSSVAVVSFRDDGMWIQAFRTSDGWSNRGAVALERKIYFPALDESSLVYFSSTSEQVKVKDLQSGEIRALHRASWHYNFESGWMRTVDGVSTAGPLALVVDGSLHLYRLTHE